jgi:hypothetical protein
MMNMSTCWKCHALSSNLELETNHGTNNSHSGTLSTSDRQWGTTTLKTLYSIKAPNGHQKQGNPQAFTETNPKHCSPQTVRRSHPPCHGPWEDWLVRMQLSPCRLEGRTAIMAMSSQTSHWTHKHHNLTSSNCESFEQMQIRIHHLKHHAVQTNITLSPPPPACTPTSCGPLWY